ncbi:MAG: methylenetetrahydrofolate reductase [bacterium]
MAERSDFAAALAAGQFVTSVEVNPPAGLDLAKKIEAARALRDFGVTTVNIADGPRASLNMSNLAMAVEVQRATGLSPLLHVCCRDRNFLGLQSHLLGAHVLGLRNLVVITGDPPKMGPYPHATGVYDVDSIGLLNVITGFNRGIDPAGKPTDAPTAFVSATGAEPAAVDHDRDPPPRDEEGRRRSGGDDAARLRSAVFERFLDDTAHIRHAGDGGPLPPRQPPQRLVLAPECAGHADPALHPGPHGGGRRAGAGAERSVASPARPSNASATGSGGAYIMPPFGRYKVAMEVLEGYNQRSRPSPRRPSPRRPSPRRLQPPGSALTVASAVAGCRPRWSCRRPALLAP